MLTKAMSIPIIITSAETPPPLKGATSAEDVILEYGSEEEETKGSGPSRTPTPLTFFTAVGIARWMARAYGYRPKKKELYVSQDKNVRRATMGTVRYPYSHMALKSPMILSAEQGSSLSQSLTGDEEKDQKIIIEWLTSSFGGHDEAYYQAYSREVIRQTKKLMGIEDIPAWY